MGIIINLSTQIRAKKMGITPEQAEYDELLETLADESINLIDELIRKLGYNDAMMALSLHLDKFADTLVDSESRISNDGVDTYRKIALSLRDNINLLNNLWDSYDKQDDDDPGPIIA